MITKTKLTTILLFFAMLGIYMPTWSQITPQEAVVAMGRGINMGNTLDAPYEGDWAASAEEEFFDLYVEAGFKTVRIPITWRNHISSESPFTIDADFLDRVEQVVDWGLSRDLFIVINAHHEDWLKNDYENQKERFDSVWSQISIRFKDRSEKLIFEMLNEPHGSITAENVDELNERILGIIRDNNPTRLVIFSGAGYTSLNDLLKAAIPEDDYLMAYYHTYAPWEFAGQSVGTWGTPSDISAMSAAMDRAKNWSEENNIPILIGEFGAKNSCDYNSRMLHYASNTALALAHGFTFTVWEDGGWFGMFNRETKTWNELKDILIYSSDSSTTLLTTEMVDDTIVQLSWTQRSNTQSKILVQKGTSGTNFDVVVELNPTDPSTYNDSNTVLGEYIYYRIVNVYGEDSIPSYPIRNMRINEQRPYSGSAISIPGTIEAEDYDKGGELSAYHDTEIENLGNAYRTSEAVDIEEREDGYHVGYTKAGEWMEYTIDVSEAGLYNITAYLASALGGGTMELDFDYVKTEEIVAPKTESWTDFQIVEKTVDLNEGEQIVRLNINTVPGFNIDKIEFNKLSTAAIDNSSVKIKMFPSPVNDALHIASDKEISLIQTYNSNGQLLMTQHVNSPNVSIDVKHLKPGIYIVSVHTNEGVVKNKFIKR